MLIEPRLGLCVLGAAVLAAGMLRPGLALYAGGLLWVGGSVQSSLATAIAAFGPMLDDQAEAVRPVLGGSLLAALILGVWVAMIPRLAGRPVAASASAALASLPVGWGLGRYAGFAENQMTVMQTVESLAPAALGGVFMVASAFVAPKWAVLAAGLAGLVGTQLGPAPKTRGSVAEHPALTSESLRASIRAGAEHLVLNMQEGGKFTYIVKAPNGGVGPGYNYPRHAGTAWFLARAGAVLNEPKFTGAAVAALGHLETVSGQVGNRAYVLDPTRKDGRSWIGTVALAVLGARRAGYTSPVVEGWERQLLASVDAQGKVRGEMILEDGSFPEQDANGYGQGQVMLALTQLPAGTEALARAREYVEGGGYYGTPTPLWVGDEHWMCLAAVADSEHGGLGVCRPYAGIQAATSPVSGGRGGPPVSGAGGAAEAVVAVAWLEGSGFYREASLNYGGYFLAQQYGPDAHPALAGGFGPGDVQIDTVQHVGSALLGVLAIVEGKAEPGMFE